MINVPVDRYDLGGTAGEHNHFFLGKIILFKQTINFLVCKHPSNYLLTRHMVRLTSVVQLDVPSYWRPGGCGFNPRQGRQHSFVEIAHEIFSTVILPLPLIQEGQLSVSAERMCTILVNCLED